MNIYVASNLQEALKLKQDHPSFLWLAGGSDIMVYRKFGKIDPEGLIDIHRLPELQKVKKTEGFLEMGAGMTFSQLLENPLVQEYLPDLVEALSTVGSIQVRNQGTLGGNIANASPAGDSLPVLYLREVMVRIRSLENERMVKINDLIQGPGNIALKPEELILSVLVPEETLPERYGFLKIAPRKALAITKVSLAFHEHSRNSCWEGRIALGSIGPTVIRPEKTENYLHSHPLSRDILPEIEPIFKKEIQAIDDIRSHAWYRSEVAFELLKRALQFD